jgi:hypothetical protein
MDRNYVCIKATRQARARVFIESKKRREFGVHRLIQTACAPPFFAAVGPLRSTHASIEMGPMKYRSDALLVRQRYPRSVNAWSAGQTQRHIIHTRSSRRIGWHVPSVAAVAAQVVS